MSNTDKIRKMIITVEKVITSHHRGLSKGRGKIMGQAAIVFRKADRFLYGITKNKSGITLHAMPMYCHPEIKDTYKTVFKNAKFLKGCVGFSVDERLEIRTLKAFIKACEQYDNSTDSS